MFLKWPLVFSMCVRFNIPTLIAGSHMQFIYRKINALHGLYLPLEAGCYINKKSVSRLNYVDFFAIMSCCLIKVDLVVH